VEKFWMRSKREELKYKNMPFTFILLLIYLVAVVSAIVGVAKKIKALKIAAVLLFLIGIILTLFLVLALRNM